MATLITIVNGCTDPEACNYDEFANVEDGSLSTLSSFTIAMATCLTDENVWMSASVIICEVFVFGC